MTERRPLVRISGSVNELPVGDSVVGVTIGSLTAGSGLFGGGKLSNEISIGLALASNPSGLVYNLDPSGVSLSLDGQAQAIADTALASGSFAVSEGTVALASGDAAASLASEALASGNAALTDLSNKPTGVVQTFNAGSVINVGDIIGLDDSGAAQSIGVIPNISGVGFGDLSEFAGNDPTSVASVYDSTNNKVVVLYQDTGGTSRLRGCVGTVSGTQIFFGSSVQLATDVIDKVSADFHSGSSQVVVCYGNSATGTGRCLLAAVSGTTLTAGAPSSFDTSHNPPYLDVAAYPSSTNRFVVFFKDTGAGNRATAKIGNFSGLTISSYGADVTVDASAVNYTVVEADPASTNRFVFTYEDNATSTGVLGLATNTTTSNFVTQDTTTYGASLTFPDLAYDSVSDQFILTYEQSNRGRSSLVDRSGNTINGIGPAAILYNNVNNIAPKCVSDVSNERLLYAVTNRVIQAAVISGTTIIPQEFTSVSTDNLINSSAALVYDSNSNRAVYSARNLTIASGSSVVITESLVVKPTLSSKNNFIGLAQTAAASGSPVQVRLPGSYDSTISGLTAGSLYYVDPIASGLSTTSSPGNWSGTLTYSPVGRALNSSTFLLTDTL